jgi:hypothetical protein
LTGDNKEGYALATFGVTFVVARPVLDLDGLEQAFYESHDGLISQSDGRILITVYGEGTNGSVVAKSLAIELESTLEISITSVDQDLVDIPEIARRTSRSRQNILQLATGSRGPRTFPVPLGTPGGKRIWDWASVDEWFRNWRGSSDGERWLTRAEVSIVNAWLSERKSVSLIQVQPGNSPLDASAAVWLVYTGYPHARRSPWQEQERKQSVVERRLSGLKISASG